VARLVDVSTPEHAECERQMAAELAEIRAGWDAYWREWRHRARDARVETAIRDDHDSDGAEPQLGGQSPSAVLDVLASDLGTVRPMIRPRP
jgi:hypothetical protein